MSFAIDGPRLHSRYRRIKCPTLNTRAHWLAYYVDRFNRHGLESSAHMAMFYAFLIACDGEGEPMSNPPGVWRLGYPLY